MPLKLTRKNLSTITDDYQFAHSLRVHAKTKTKKNINAKMLVRVIAVALEKTKAKNERKGWRMKSV